MIRKCLYLLVGVSLLCSCQSKNLKDTGDKPQIQITSTAFEDGGIIPKKYTCDDVNISPPLSWTGIPAGTKSLALICDDPDAPAGVWVHWVIFNLPPDSTELKENVPPQKVLSNGAKQGKNDFGNMGYGGPCPPNGIHRYYFKIYALDTVLTQDGGISKAELLKAMDGHILAQGQLMGKYKRN